MKKEATIFGRKSSLLFSGFDFTNKESPQQSEALYVLDGRLLVS
jgi:TolB-like protein